MGELFLVGVGTSKVLGALTPTWHVDHTAVAVLHNVAGLTVNPTGGDAVNRKEVEPHLGGPTLPPWWGQIRELEDRQEGGYNHPWQRMLALFP